MEKMEKMEKINLKSCLRDSKSNLTPLHNLDRQIRFSIFLKPDGSETDYGRL